MTSGMGVGSHKNGDFAELLGKGNLLWFIEQLVPY